VSTNVGTAYLEVIPSAKGFASKLQSDIAPGVTKTGSDAGKKAAGGFSNTFGAGFKKMLVATGALTAGSAIISFFGDSIAASRESAKVNALTAQVIKTTGGAAGVTAAQIGKLSTALSLKTGVDDEAIQSGANLLLTFKDIRNEAGRGNDIFNQATATANDMSVALGQDMKSSSIQLGKALNDPIKGVTALQRVGVSFTGAQKNQIKALVESGNTMKAQKLILKELNSEFGGAAAAAVTPADKARVAWDNMKETLGNKVMPIVDKFSTLLTTKLIPFVSDLGNRFMDAMGGSKGFSDAIASAAPFVKVLGAIFGWLARVIIPIVAVAFRLIMWNIGMIGSAIMDFWKLSQPALHAFGAIWKWLWNKAIKPMVNFILTAIAAVLHGLANLASAAGLDGLATKLDKAADAAAGLKNAINGLKNKKVTVTYFQKVVGSSQGGKNAAEIAGNRAFGGPVGANRTYLVGERGPELFVPGANGRILPNSALAPKVPQWPSRLRIVGIGSDYIETVVDDRVSSALEFAG